MYVLLLEISSLILISALPFSILFTFNFSLQSTNHLRSSCVHELSVKERWSPKGIANIMGTNGACTKFPDIAEVAIQ